MSALISSAIRSSKRVALGIYFSQIKVLPEKVHIYSGTNNKGKSRGDGGRETEYWFSETEKGALARPPFLFLI
jgi:hypothetical protein